MHEPEAVFFPVEPTAAGQKLKARASISSWVLLPVHRTLHARDQATRANHILDRCGRSMALLAWAEAAAHSCREHTAIAFNHDAWHHLMTREGSIAQFSQIILMFASSTLRHEAEIIQLALVTGIHAEIKQSAHAILPPSHGSHLDFMGQFWTTQTSEQANLPICWDAWRLLKTSFGIEILSSAHKDTFQTLQHISFCTMSCMTSYKYEFITFHVAKKRLYWLSTLLQTALSAFVLPMTGSMMHPFRRSPMHRALRDPVHGLQLCARRFMVSARNKLWWCTPEWGKTAADIPPETQFLLAELDGPDAGSPGGSLLRPRSTIWPGHL